MLYAMLFTFALAAMTLTALVVWKQVVIDELTAANARLTRERDGLRAACKGVVAGLLGEGEKA